MPGHWNRAEVLATVRHRLWRYLSACASPVQLSSVAEDLWRLPRGDLLRLTAAHLALLPETQEMLEAAALVLKELPSSIARSEVELVGSVRGPVNWTRTQQRQLATADPTRFVCRPVERRYDTPLARLVLLALRRCIELGSLAELQASGAAGNEVATVVARATHLAAHRKLVAVTVVPHLSERTLESLRRYRHTEPLIRFVRQVRHALYDLHPESLDAIITSQLLMPATDDTLFELMAGFLITDALIKNGGRQSFRLIAGGGVPFAQLDAPLPITIWWQRSLWALQAAGDGQSRYEGTLRAASMTLGKLRPDFLIVCHDPPRLVVVEVKQTADAAARPERRGVLEAMAYLHDAQDVFRRYPYPHALVVGWNARAIPGEGQIVVANQDNVADAVASLLDNWNGTSSP